MGTTDAMIIMLKVTKKESTGRLPDSFLLMETNIFSSSHNGYANARTIKKWECADDNVGGWIDDDWSVVSQIRIDASQIEGCSNNILVLIDAFYNNDYDRVDVYQIDTGPNDYLQ